jgi:hypothetical protein
LDAQLKIYLKDCLFKKEIEVDPSIKLLEQQNATALVPEFKTSSTPEK